jgi:hypothetical protein
LKRDNISANPGERKGDSTSWFSAFWKFCEKYLNDRFKEDWCVSAEQINPTDVYDKSTYLIIELNCSDEYNTFFVLAILS